PRDVPSRQPHGRTRASGSQRSGQPFRRVKPPAGEVPGPGFARENGDAEFRRRAQPAVTQDHGFERDPAGEGKTADADALPRNINFPDALGFSPGGYAPLDLLNDDQP